MNQNLFLKRDYCFGIVTFDNLFYLEIIFLLPHDVGFEISKVLSNSISMFLLMIFILGADSAVMQEALLETV